MPVPWDLMGDVRGARTSVWEVETGKGGGIVLYEIARCLLVRAEPHNTRLEGSSSISIGQISTGLDTLPNAQTINWKAGEVKREARTRATVRDRRGNWRGG